MTPRVAFPIIASLWLAAAAAQTPPPPQTPPRAGPSIVTASVSGQVTDPTGAVVPGAQIQATNKESGQTFTAKADGSGYYRVPVPAGTYNVEISSSGFAKVLHRDIVAGLNASLRLDSKLELGNYTETVVVAAVPTLETGTSSVGSTFSSAQIDALP